MKDSILKKKTLMICGIEVAVEWKKIKNMYNYLMKMHLNKKMKFYMDKNSIKKI